MKQKRFVLVLLLTLSVFLAAQENKPLIQLTSFFIEGLGQEESRLIESLVQDYLSDIGELISFLQPQNPEAAFPARLPDYTISGNIRLEQDGPVLELEISNAKTGERFSFNSVYKSTGELALKTRSALEAAFHTGSMETAQKPALVPEPLGENRITGAWKGEAGIEMIRLQRGGRGVAVFSSGAQMVLSYVIENNVLKITQNSPNSERFYYPLPRETAQKLAAAAEPMRWELSLYQQGTVLSGIRLGTGIRLVNGYIAEFLSYGDVRDITWTKSGR